MVLVDRDDQSRSSNKTRAVALCHYAIAIVKKAPAQTVRLSGQPRNSLVRPDSPPEGGGFEPSVPRMRPSPLQVCAVLFGLQRGVRARCAGRKCRGGSDYVYTARGTTLLLGRSRAARSLSPVSGRGHGCAECSTPRARSDKRSMPRPGVTGGCRRVLLAPVLGALVPRRGPAGSMHRA